MYVAIEIATESAEAKGYHPILYNNPPQ